MKSYLLRLIAILVVASAAGITHSLIVEPLKLKLDEIPEEQGTIVLPPKATTADPIETATPEQADPSESPIDTPTTIVLKREITLDQARMLYENGLADFIDARPKKDYEQGHILGAYNVPPDAFQTGTPAVIDFFEEDRRVVVYCTGGDCHDSHVVIEQMMAIRPELVLLHVFTDGYPAWTQAGLPTDTGPDPLAE